jgi:hypothetical protein
MPDDTADDYTPPTFTAEQWGQPLDEVYAPPDDDDDGELAFAE